MVTSKVRVGSFTQPPSQERIGLVQALSFKRYREMNSAHFMQQRCQLPVKDDGVTSTAEDLFSISFILFP
jgi:hypothetical protein